MQVQNNVHDRLCRFLSEGNINCPLFESLGANLAELTLDFEWLVVNKRCCELVGYSQQELVSRPFNEVFPSRRPAREEEDLRRLLAGRVSSYSSERLGVRKDGRGVWVKAIVTLSRDPANGEPSTLLVVLEEITPLKDAERILKDSEVARNHLGRLMMNAQDEDRARIARELHDDIGQSLAVLKIQMLRAGQPKSGRPDQAHPALPQLAATVKEIAEKVSNLSHQLHSSELEFLGLTIAVKSHCREWSERFHVALCCECEGPLDNLDSTVALSFLRVVQEALHNVAKHSGAKKVVVELRSNADVVTLTISDDGVGFDTEHARLVPGLGLISMRERMHLVGGELEISSRAERGTKILARASILKEKKRSGSHPAAVR
jgi:PAS domain S-box-containing protein